MDPNVDALAHPLAGVMREAFDRLEKELGDSTCVIGIALRPDKLKHTLLDVGVFLFPKAAMKGAQLPLEIPAGEFSSWQPFLLGSYQLVRDDPYGEIEATFGETFRPIVVRLNADAPTSNDVFEWLRSSPSHSSELLSDGPDKGGVQPSLF